MKLNKMRRRYSVRLKQDRPKIRLKLLKSNLLEKFRKSHILYAITFYWLELHCEMKRYLAQKLRSLFFINELLSLNVAAAHSARQ